MRSNCVSNNLYQECRLPVSSFAMVAQNFKLFGKQMVTVLEKIDAILEDVLGHKQSLYANVLIE